jgi:hypothetical protein
MIDFVAPTATIVNEHHVLVQLMKWNTSMIGAKNFALHHIRANSGGPFWMLRGECLSTSLDMFDYVDHERFGAPRTSEVVQCSLAGINDAGCRGLGDTEAYVGWKYVVHE